MFKYLSIIQIVLCLTNILRQNLQEIYPSIGFAIINSQNIEISFEIILSFK